MDLPGENPLIHKCLRVSRTTRFSAPPFAFLGLLLGRGKAGRFAYSWGGAKRDASLTPWEGKAGALRLLRTRALGQQLIEFRKAGGGTDLSPHKAQRKHRAEVLRLF
jgi:hypothetical protein